MFKKYVLIVDNKYQLMYKVLAQVKVQERKGKAKTKKARKASATAKNQKVMNFREKLSSD